jgi:glycerol-3-phosphate dehydrogenase
VTESSPYVTETHAADPDAPFDVAVIGAGVVGCAVLRRFTLEGARAILLERAPDLLAGASKGNSAILHTGFDAPPGSLELACIRAGYAEYRAIRERLNLPELECGAILVAWREAELARLDAMLAQAHGNGIRDVRPISRAEVLAREPGLSPALLGGILVPGEHLVDPWSAPLAYLFQAVANGAVVLFGAGVAGGKREDGVWTLRTAKGPIRARAVVNCAGLEGDRVEAMLLGEASFAIRPRKGQFVVFDKAAARHLRSIVLPVPDERTKGIVLAPTVFGNVLVGPTAEEQESRERASLDGDTLRALVQEAARILPALGGMPVTAAYAGLRPASERKEYRVRHERERGWITLGGIRSTGLTAALGIARHAFELHMADGARRYVPIAEPVWPEVPNLAEHRTRDWERPGHGEIVCHCELVTRREIEAALSGPLPAGDFGGLKRRTRAGMGRCQGFYCSARLAELTSGRFAVPLALGACRG